MTAEEQANPKSELLVRDEALVFGKGGMLIEGNVGGDVIGPGGRKSG